MGTWYENQQARTRDEALIGPQLGPELSDEAAHRIVLAHITEIDGEQDRIARKLSGSRTAPAEYVNRGQGQGQGQGG